MKVSWISWWIVNLFWFVLFVIGSVFIWIREVDGAGVYQTPEAKLIAFIVLVIAFIFPLIIQLIWLIINLVVSRKSKLNSSNNA